MKAKKQVQQEPKLCPFTFGNPNGAGKCQGKECSLWIPEGGLYTIEGVRAQGGCSLYFNPQMNSEGRVVV